MKIEDFEKGAWFTLPFSKNNTKAGSLYFGVIKSGTNLVKYLDEVADFDYVRPEWCIQTSFGEVPRPKVEVEEQPMESVEDETANTTHMHIPEDFGTVYGQKPVIASQFSVQVGGNHYSKRGIQPLEFILANKLDFCQGNVVKYVTRFRDKNGAEDLKKVIHYTMFLLEDEYGILSEVRYSDSEKA